MQLDRALQDVDKFLSRMANLRRPEGVEASSVFSVAEKISAISTPMPEAIFTSLS